MKSDPEITIPVVIDTNVLVPSLYRETPLFNYILTGNLVLIWNNFIYQEAKAICEKLYMKVYYKATNANDLDKVFRILEIIFFPNNKVSEMPFEWPEVSRDRSDDPFLFAADEGGANYIISQDKPHLLALGTFRSIPIGTPKEFFDWANKNHPFPNDK